MSDVQVVIGSEVFPIVAGTVTTIGRSTSSNIQLRDPRVSRKHAEIRMEDGNWMLIDTSSGGLWIDGLPAKRVRVDRPLTVRLGAEGAPTMVVQPGSSAYAAETVVGYSPSALATAPALPSPPNIVGVSHPVASVPSGPVGLQQGPVSNPRPIYRKKRFIAAGITGLLVGAVALSDQPADDQETAQTEVVSSVSESPTESEEVDEATPVTTEPPGEEQRVELVLSSRETPFAFDSAAAIEWDVFGDADRSIWNATVQAPVDITQAVLAENQFNDPPPEGFVFAGFPVSMTLAQADKVPLAVGFNVDFEIIGGDSDAAHDGRCGVVPNEFPEFQEAYVGGTIQGTICVPIPEADLGHPDTVVAFKFSSDSRQFFGDSGVGGSAIEPAIPQFDQLDQREGGRAVGYSYDSPVDVVWEVLGDANNSVWSTTVSAPRDITAQVREENQFNDAPPEGYLFAGYDVALVLSSAEKEPLSAGFNVSFEIVGGATNIAHSGECGVTPNEFDLFAEVFAGGSLTGTVCVSLPIEDLAHPNTRVALKFDSETRSYFG